MGSEFPGVRTSQHRSPIPTFPKGKEKSQNKGPAPIFFKKKSVTTIP